MLLALLPDLPQEWGERLPRPCATQPPKGPFWCCCGVPTSPPAEKAAQVMKRAGRRTWRPARVVREAGGVSGGAAAGGTCGGGDLAVEIPRSVSLNAYAGFTLSADTVTGLPRTES